MSATRGGPGCPSLCLRVRPPLCMTGHGSRARARMCVRACVHACARTGLRAARALRLLSHSSHPGKAVRGESGELVCTRPFPSQPTHFWNDEDGSKYRKAYFSRFPGGRRCRRAARTPAWAEPRPDSRRPPTSPPARQAPVKPLAAPSTGGVIMSFGSVSATFPSKAGW